MTLETARRVLTAFFTTDKPEVLALKGAWGVGKTFTWQQVVRDNKNRVALENYCYVSLFGVSSVAEIKTAIFAKTQGIARSDDAIQFAPRTVLARVFERVKPWTRLASRFRELPVISQISVSIEILAPYLIQKGVICLDDLERLNPKVKPEEILGLITELKEEKGCKIILIYNDAELKKAEAFAKYIEKVVDFELPFAPTAEEAAGVALPNYLSYRDLISTYTVRLGITNIRILRRIEALAARLYTATRTMHAGVFESAICILALLVWCRYDQDKVSNKPPLDFVLTWNSFEWVAQGLDKQRVGEPSEAWADQLHEYGLRGADEFMRSINKFIQQGFLEGSGFSEEAAKLNETLRAGDQERPFSEAWNLFHHSFDDNRTELVNGLVQSAKSAVKQVSVGDLHSTVHVLRELGESKLADEVLEHYIEMHADTPRIFDLSAHPFSGKIDDPTLRTRFAEEWNKRLVKMTLLEVATAIAERNGWSNEHIELLKSASVDDFYRLFKEQRGDLLRRIVKACLRFERMSGHTDIGEKTRTALVRIAQENRLNELRVETYGVSLEHPMDTKSH